MKWYIPYLEVYEKPFDEQAFSEVISEIKANIAAMQSPNPIATLSVIAYNEEKHLLSCLWALSRITCKYPIEIIGINNNSKDFTEEIFKSVGIPYYNETKQSCGHARLCGLTNAKGKYHFNIDADTLYPTHYFETIIDYFEAHDEVVGISATWSYIPDVNHSAFGIWFYTKLRDSYLWLQSIKRPELSVRGLVFAYRTKQAQATGIRTDIIRGEDGYLAFQLKNYGKIHFMRTRNTCAITGYGTVNSSLLSEFFVRVRQAIKKIGRLFGEAREYKDDRSNLVQNN